MVATQNIDTLGTIWTFSLRGVLTFVASGLDINGCVLSYLRGQQIYTVIQAVHSLHYIVAKCHFFSVVTWKDRIKYLQKCEGCTHFCEMNEWRMNGSIYIALLLCIAIHPKRFTIMRGVSPQPPPVCSIHLDDTVYTFFWFAAQETFLLLLLLINAENRVIIAETD